MSGTAHERVCPWCAETVKAAAIRCRFCRSDLEPFVPEPDLAADTACDEFVEVSEPTADSAEDQEAPRASFSGRFRNIVTAPAVLRAVLMLICVVLGAGSIWLVVDDPSLSKSRESAVEVLIPGATGEGVLATDPFALATRNAAADLAVSVLSYSHKTLDQDQARARAVMAPEFVTEYDDVMKAASPKARKAELTLKATVVGSSLVSLDLDKAVALLFINSETTSAKSAKTQLDNGQVLMTMTRQDGDWIVSKIDTI